MFENLKDKVGGLASNPSVQEAINKAKDFANSEEGKEKIKEAKDKAEDFVAEKTDGKGILGFGKK